MADEILTNTRVVFIKDPTSLPRGVNHGVAIDALAKANKAVILMSHGNQYKFNKHYILPDNATIIEYDLDMHSIQLCTLKLRELLRSYGITLQSRHLDDSDPMPILLSGACLTMNIGTQLTFINTPEEYVHVKETLETPVSHEDHDWDLI